ncbi:macro domain-containing protein [Saccharopolyspora hattusasensis]|uniref:macro domain-containing protein n=1 Tax=Saccharopolyspora hattusasensis TaxID=1128679 RepID=UPI003D985275
MPRDVRGVPQPMSRLVRTGEIDVHVADDVASHRRIVVANFPTKRHWHDGSRIEWIEQGLTALPRIITEHHAGSIAVPPLGCGLGGLDWALVPARITEALTPVAQAGVDVLVYPPPQHASRR